MRIIGFIAWLLLVIGGLNWGLIAVAQMDVVAEIFGAGTSLTRLVYGLVGLSAIYSIFFCRKCCKCKDNSCKM